jgi:predicted nucleic acid-binding protein
MSDVVVDSCIVAKWLLPEHDSAQADRLLVEVAQRGDRPIVLDLAFIEVANAIWKRLHRGLSTSAEAEQSLDTLLALPLHVEPALPRLRRAGEIAGAYDRSLYDALFVALAGELGVTGITSDEPLHRAVHADFPEILLLRDWT